MFEGVSQALPWVFARERKHSPVCAFNHIGGCCLSGIEGPALEKDQSNKESAGTRGTSARPSRQPRVHVDWSSFGELQLEVQF